MNLQFRLWLENEWKKFPHQKLLPFAQDHENPLYQYAKPFLGSDYEDFGLEDSQYEPQKLYHVTTNLNGVKAKLALKSRQELGNKTIGLRGGPSNMAPNMVSLTYNYSRALEIYEGLKFVTQIAENKILASEIYSYASSDNYDYYDDETLSNVDEVLVSFGVPKKVILSGDTNALDTILNRKITTPKQKYEFLQELENARIDDDKVDYSDTVEFQQVIGFTAPFESIKNLKLDQIAIVQVLLRKHANTEHYWQEAEIRVSSQDIAIIRYIQP